MHYFFITELRRILAHSNFEGTVNDEHYKDDAEVEDVNDAMSWLSFDNDSFDDTMTTGFKSVHYQQHQNNHSPSVVSGQGGGFGKIRRSGGGRKSLSSVYGLTTLGLPYILDKWHDALTQHRISIQVLLPSGMDLHKKTLVPVSMDKKEVVITLQMSRYFSCPKNAFDSFLVDELGGSANIKQQCFFLVI